MSGATLRELVELSNHLGRPELDWAILGEGNTSARADAGSFWIKASGACLATAADHDFVRVDAAPILAALDGGDLDDAGVRQLLQASRQGSAPDRLPSVETFMHAACLELDGVQVVGHTHPTAVNMVTCSRAFPEALEGRLFPDQVVVCGSAPVTIPYVDPGLPLAREIRRRLVDHIDTYGERPRVIYLQNHGLVALGATARQVRDITAMAVKAARILVGTHALGGPEFMPPADVRRIQDRPDEHHRRRVLGQHDETASPE
jgi:rhamnose utilization protein RhaD (predicted bifunctional aldolase and dehydrogenase)